MLTCLGLVVGIATGTAGIATRTAGIPTPYFYTVSVPKLRHLRSASPVASATSDTIKDVDELKTAASTDISLRKAENSEIAGLAGPALLGTLIDPFLSLVDTLYVGRIGAVAGTSSSYALGAVAASSELFTLCFAISLALRETASSTLARLFAQGRTDEAATFATRTLQLALCAGTLLAFVFGGPSASWCVGLMGAPVGSPLHVDALLYARVRSFALPFAIAIPAAEGIFRGMGNTRMPLRAAILSLAINLVLDPLLIFQPLGFGVAGAAAATGIAQAAACVMLVRTMRKELMTPGQGMRAASAPPLSTDGADGAESDDRAPTESATTAATRRLVGTSFATVLRSSSVIGCWVFIASTIGRVLGPSAIAAHGVVLKVWLLIVLAAEAPAVAGQVLCARYISTGSLDRARTLLARLLGGTAVLGVFSTAGLLALARPVANFMIPTDAALASSACQLFGWAALVTPMVAPNALLEGVLLGAGRSYRYLATSTLLIASSIAMLANFAIRLRPAPSSAWACIVLFFVLRLLSSSVRIFLVPRGGFGHWRHEGKEKVFD